MVFCTSCGKPVENDARFCKTCGSPQELPAAEAQPAGQAARQGKLLHVPRGATLPAYCVRCGAPSSGEPIKQNFSWHTPWLYLLIIPGVLIYVIVAAMVSKKCSLAVPVCDAHRAQRRNFLFVGLTTLITCIPIGVIFGRLIGGPDDVGWALTIIIVLFITSIVLLVPVRALLQPTFIDETRATFKKAGENFLNMLPEMPAGAGT
jgi:double zinc ribbon protein